MENVLADSALLRLRRPAKLLCLASDERLVALVRAGDEGAFEALYDRHHVAILGFSRHMLGTREEAEDAVQHTFLAAFRDLVGSDKPIELRPWLFAIARNRCLSLLRARRPHVALELAEPATDGLAATVERREDLRELLVDLARLPEDQRAALLLSELGALDHAQIATVLGCPREKVKALVFQARTSLAASREARATPCDDIRLELATASGAALRRGPLRRHLRACDGCRAFKAEVATQRGMFALALPVVPSVALKAGVLAGTGAGASASSGGAAAAGVATAGATSGATGGTLGSLVGTVASTGAGKVAVSLVVASAVAGGGTLTERMERRAATPHVTPPSSSAPSVAPQGPFAIGAPVRRGAARSTPADGLTAPTPAHGGQPSPADPAPAPGASRPVHEAPPQDAGGLPVADRAPAHAIPSPPTPATGEVRHQGDGALPTPTLPPQAQAESKPPSSPPPASHRAPPTAGQPAGGGPPTAPPGGGKPAETAKSSQQPAGHATKAQGTPSTGMPLQAAASAGKPSQGPPSADKAPQAGPPAGKLAQGQPPADRSPQGPPSVDKPRQAAPPAGRPPQAPPAGAGSSQPSRPPAVESPPAAKSGGSHGQSGESRGRAS
jgi:RNA polymerase sigma factor (sigma-70 family)